MVSIEKLTITLLNKRIQPSQLDHIPFESVIQYGVQEADKCLGIRVATPGLVGDPWYAKVAEIEQMAIDVTAGRRLSGSIYARSAVAQGAFISKVFHTFAVQAPFEGARDVAIKRLQEVVNRLVFSKFYNVTLATAMQPAKDAGIGHINVRRRLQAGWARHIHRLMSPRPAAWKNVWWFELRQIYGPLVDYDMPLTTCTYQLVNMSVGPSQIQKLALKAWACLRLAPAALVKPELSQAGQSRHALAAYSGKSIDTQPVWKQQVRENITGVHVADMRLWFNNCTAAAVLSRMHMPSTYATEKEAIEWAQAGLIRNKDVINGTRIQGTSAFRNKHPTLDTSLIHATRTDMPEEYRIAPEDGTHMSQAEHDCLPRGLLDDEQDDRRQRRRSSEHAEVYRVGPSAA